MDIFVEFVGGRLVEHDGVVGLVLDYGGVLDEAEDREDEYGASGGACEMYG